jgi:hypothetical protein
MDNTVMCSAHDGSARVNWPDLNALFLFRQKERLERRSCIFVTAKDIPDVLEQFLGPNSFSGFHTTDRVTDYLSM